MLPLPYHLFLLQRRVSCLLLHFQIDTLSRRPGLREKFPRQQLSTDYNDVHYAHNYLPTVERLVENKRPTRGDSSAARRSSERRSANRSLKFEVPQQTNTARRKRASWCGHSARTKDDTPSRRQCKSARKSKDCMIPGCTKGARSRGLCKRHGGGKRCTFSGCVRSDQGGGFCIAHGGGGHAFQHSSLFNRTKRCVYVRVEQANDAPLKDARTLLSRADVARVMEVRSKRAIIDEPVFICKY